MRPSSRRQNSQKPRATRSISLPAGRADPVAGRRPAALSVGRVPRRTDSGELGGQSVLGPARQSVVVGDHQHPVTVVPFTAELEAVDEREAGAGGADPTTQVLSKPVKIGRASWRERKGVVE